jgi:hypothetical protein
MNDKRILYESMLNEHTRIQNQISDIKAESYELNDQQKRDIQVLE